MLDYTTFLESYLDCIFALYFPVGHLVHVEDPLDTAEEPTLFPGEQYDLPGLPHHRHGFPPRDRLGEHWPQVHARLTLKAKARVVKVSPGFHQSFPFSILFRSLPHSLSHSLSCSLTHSPISPPISLLVSTLSRSLSHSLSHSCVLLPVSLLISPPVLPP